MDSFNYDFHLKLIHTYVTGALSGMKVFNKNQSSLPLLKKGFRVIEFLNDFSSQRGYYHKHPINSNTFLESQSITVPISVQRYEMTIFKEDSFPNSNDYYLHESIRLFNYLKENESLFKFKSMRMDVSSTNANLTADVNSSLGLSNEDRVSISNDFVLTRQALYQIESKDERIQNDKELESIDLSVTLIVSHANDTERNDENEKIDGMRLKYFVIITPKLINNTNAEKSEEVEKRRVITLKHLPSRGSVSLSNCGIASQVDADTKER